MVPNMMLKICFQICLAVFLTNYPERLRMTSLLKVQTQLRASSACNLFLLCIFNQLCTSIYRVSRNTLATYVIAISRLPGHLELKSWTFSWSPFNSKFKTVLILIPIIKIDQISTLRRKKRKLKPYIFLNKNNL